MYAVQLLNNAHQTGVLINLSLSDYSTRKKSDDGNVVFSILHDKTATVHDAATLAVSADEAKLLDGYMKIQRLSQFPKASPYVFVNHTGSQMAQSNIKIFIQQLVAEKNMRKNAYIYIYIYIKSEIQQAKKRRKTQ